MDRHADRRELDRLGELHSLLGRGLEVTYASGFVHGARMSLEPSARTIPM